MQHATASQTPQSRKYGNIYNTTSPVYQVTWVVYGPLITKGAVRHICCSKRHHICSQSTAGASWASWPMVRVSQHTTPGSLLQQLPVQRVQGHA